MKDRRIGMLKDCTDKIKKIQEYYNDTLFTRIVDLDVSYRIKTCMSAERIIFIGDIICNPSFKNYSYLNTSSCFGRLIKIPNFSKKSLEMLMIAFGELGFNQYIDFPDYIRHRLFKIPETYDFTIF